MFMRVLTGLRLQPPGVGIFLILILILILIVILPVSRSNAYERERTSLHSMPRSDARLSAAFTSPSSRPVQASRSGSRRVVVPAQNFFDVLVRLPTDAVQWRLPPQPEKMHNRGENR